MKKSEKPIKAKDDRAGTDPSETDKKFVAWIDKILSSYYISTTVLLLLVPISMLFLAFGMRMDFFGPLMFGSAIAIVCVNIFQLLQTSDSKNSLDPSSGSATISFEMLEQQVSATSERGLDQTILTDEEREKLADTIRDKLQEAELENHIKLACDAYVKSDALIFFEDRHKIIITELKQAIRSFSLRGNINLAIGIFSGLSGVAFLLFTFFGAYGIPAVGSSEYSEQIIIELYIPRVTIALFIGTFSYFFLRLYKRSLVEVKGFHEAILCERSKFMALCYSIKICDNSAHIEVLKSYTRASQAGRSLMSQVPPYVKEAATRDRAD